MPLPLIVCCFSKIQISFTFLVSAHLGSPRKRAIKRVCVSCWPEMVIFWVHIMKYSSITFYWYMRGQTICCQTIVPNVDIFVNAEKLVMEYCRKQVHIGSQSHSVTCHLAEVTFPPSPQQSWYSIQREGCNTELTYLVGYILRWYTRPKMVTHPSTNRARRRVTLFIWQMTLPLHHAANNPRLVQWIQWTACQCQVCCYVEAQEGNCLLIIWPVILCVTWSYKRT